MKKIDAAWTMEQTKLEHELDSDVSMGLSSFEVEERLKEVGNNKITQSKTITFWDILYEEIREPLILLLLVIGVMYNIWGDISDTIMILFVILNVSMVEVYTKYKAKKSIEFLKTLALPTSWVIRDGKTLEVLMFILYRIRRIVLC